MSDFIAFELIPILAVFWIVVGGLGLAGVVAASILAFVSGKPLRSEGSEVPVPPGEVVRLLGLFGGWFLLFVVLGFIFLELADRRADGAQLILSIFGSLSLLGGTVALFVLWRPRRQAS